MVFDNERAENLLDSFSAERSKVGDEVLKTASRLTAVGTCSPQALRITSANFHARLNASCMPVFMPWPPAGL